MSPPPSEVVQKMNMGDSEKQDSAPGGVKRKLAGRLKNSAPKRVKLKGPTKLRKGKPVVAEVPMDVWQTILSYCPQKFLFKACLISRIFRNVLMYESAWRKNRIQNYGEDMPDPLPGMKEKEYAHLIDGMGCMGCGNKKTRKCYWAFQKRWCAKCLERNTLSEHGAGNIRFHYPRLLDCIPYAIADSYRHYESAGNYQRSWNRAGHGRQEIYSNTAVTEMMGKIDAFLKTEPTDEARVIWYEERMSEKRDFMAKIQQIEDWVELPKRDRHSEAQRLKRERATFFQDRAMSLTPPLQTEALKLIPAYIRAVDIAKAPSERSWKALLPKLETERAAAEELLVNPIYGGKLDNAELKRRRSELYCERQGNQSPQQIRVLKVADEVLADFDHVRTISPQDFALLVLREVRSRYYKNAGKNSPEDETVSDPHHPETAGESNLEDISMSETESPSHFPTAIEQSPDESRLLLDDAIMVFKHKICPKIDERWGHAGENKKAKLFKCPGCTRADVNAKYDFEDLIAHLSKHANKVGDFAIFRKPGPETMDQGPGGIGLIMEWPKYLPILATHQTATGKWNPHDDTPYKQLQPADHKQSFSIFDGRCFCDNYDIPKENFAANAMFAAQEFAGTSLHAKYKTFFAFKYAIAQWGKLPTTQDPPIHHLDEINILLLKNGEYDLFNGFRCPTCANATASRLLKFANKDQSFSDLLTHFKNTHFEEDWIYTFMAMPSEEELWDKLNEEGMEDSLQVFQKLFPLRKDLDYCAPVARMY